MATFGNTGIGSQTDGGNSADAMEGLVATAPATGTVDSMSMYVKRNGATANVKFVLVLAATGIIVLNGISNAAAVGAALAWVTATFATPPAIVNGVDYWLLAIFDNDVTWNYDLSGTDEFDSSNSYAVPTSPTDASATPGIGPSIYATYTPSGGGSVAYAAYYQQHYRAQVVA